MCFQQFPFPVSKSNAQNGLLLLSLSFLYSISTSASRNLGQTQNNSGCLLCLILWKTMNNHSLLILWITSMTMKMSIILLHFLFKLWYFVRIETLFAVCPVPHPSSWKTVWEWREPWVPQELCTDISLIHHCLCPFLEFLEIHWIGRSFLSFTNTLSLGSVIAL